MPSAEPMSLSRKLTGRQREDWINLLVYWQLVKPGWNQSHHKPDCSYAEGRIEKISFWWPLQMKLSFLLGDAESVFWVWKWILWVWWHIVGHGGMGATRPLRQDINKINKKIFKKYNRHGAYLTLFHTKLSCPQSQCWAEPEVHGGKAGILNSWLRTCPALPGRQTSLGEDSEHVG